MVSHLIDLDGVPAAMDRLRRGEGDRSVIIIDPELAGAAPEVRREPPDSTDSSTG